MFKAIINAIVGIAVEIGAIALVMLLCFGVSWLFVARVGEVLPVPAAEGSPVGEGGTSPIN